MPVASRKHSRRLRNALPVKHKRELVIAIFVPLKTKLWLLIRKRLRIEFIPMRVAQNDVELVVEIEVSWTATNIARTYVRFAA